MSRSRKQKLLIYVAFAIAYMIMTSAARVNAPVPAPASVPENPMTHGPDEYLVTKIVDGDTIQVSENGFPDGPKKDFRYEESSRGSAWIRPRPSVPASPSNALARKHRQRTARSFSADTSGSKKTSAIRTDMEDGFGMHILDQVLMKFSLT